MKQRTLYFARTWRSAVAHRKAEGRTFTHCTFVAGPETLRHVGGTKGMARVYVDGFDGRDNWPEIRDALAMTDLFEPIQDRA